MTPQKRDQRQTLIWAAVGVALCVLMYSLSTVLTPFLIAGILAYILNPGVDWLVRHRCPRALATFLMIVLITLIVVILALTIIPVMEQQVSQIKDKLPTLMDRMNEVVAPRLQEWFGVQIQFSGESVKKLISEKWSTEDLSTSLMAYLKVGGVALLGVVANLLLIPMVLFYLLLDWPLLMKKIDNAIPRRWHDQVVNMAGEVDDLMAQYLRGQLSVMVILAVYYTTALFFAGFNVAVPVGIFTGLLVFIPYVGFATGLVLGILAALLQFDGWYGLIAVGGIYGFGQFIESFFLTPRLVGERIGMHPLAVIFALLAFGQIFGFFGVLLALPASAVLLVGLRHVKKIYLASSFYKQP